MISQAMSAQVGYQRNCPITRGSMNYEFYFLHRREQSEPEILRVMAPSYEYATALVAKQFGWDKRRQLKDYVESIDIRPVEVQNIFS